MTEEDEVPIFMALVHPPAFDDTGAYRVRVSEDQGIGMPLPTRVEQLDDPAPVVDVCGEWAEGHTLR